MKVRVGQMLSSVVDSTAVVVVRAPENEVDISCGGAAMVETQSRQEVAAAGDPMRMGGSLLGKRYVDEVVDVELLCTKGGQGSLAVDGRTLTIKAAKPMPSSD